MLIVSSFLLTEVYSMGTCGCSLRMSRWMLSRIRVVSSSSSPFCSCEGGAAVAVALGLRWAFDSSMPPLPLDFDETWPGDRESRRWRWCRWDEEDVGERERRGRRNEPELNENEGRGACEQSWRLSSNYSPWSRTFGTSSISRTGSWWTMIARGLRRSMVGSSEGKSDFPIDPEHCGYLDRDRRRSFSRLETFFDPLRLRLRCAGRRLSRLRLSFPSRRSDREAGGGELNPRHPLFVRIFKRAACAALPSTTLSFQFTLLVQFSNTRFQCR